MKKVIPTIVVLILLGVLGTIFYKNYWVRYSYSEEMTDVNEYYGVKGEDDYPVVLQDVLSDYHAKKIGDSYYLDLPIVRSEISDRFYYSAGDGMLCYCLPDTRISVLAGSDVWTDSSGAENKEPYLICVEDGDSIYIAHCRIASSASAVKFGTASYGGFRHIEVRDIEVYDTFRSAIAIETVDGGIIDDILVDGIRARNTGNPIFVCLGARHDERPGICRNIIIRNVDAEVPFGRPDEAYDLRGPEVDYFHNPWPSSICGLPGRYIENVVLENIRVSHPGRASKAMAYVGSYRLHEVNEAAASYPEFTMYGELPAWAFYVRHVRGITLRNIKAEVRDKDFRPAFIFDDVEGKTEEGVWPPTNL